MDSSRLFLFGDKLSFLLVILRVWLGAVFFLTRIKYKKNFFSFVRLKLTIIVLFVLLLFSFLRLNLFLFYIFFEVSLFPLLLFVMAWGYQVERIQARFYLFFYTIIGSFPVLVGLIFLFFILENLNWNVLCFVSVSSTWFIVIIIILLGFFVKLPLYGVHLWLPKAHVEASVIGSMVLAAILLKVGAYGVYRVFFMVGADFVFVLILAIWGAFLRAQICFTQRDLKSLVAFSSISHIGVLVCGLCYCLEIGVVGSFIILLGHGFCSSSLFFLVNLKYERSLSRQLGIIRGQLGYYWRTSIFWFLFLIVNLGAPPFLRLMGEMFIYFSLFRESMEGLIILGFTRFFVAYFCVHLFRSVVHGTPFKNLSYLFEEELTSFVLIYHFIPLVFFIVNLESFLF